MKREKSLSVDFQQVVRPNVGCFTLKHAMSYPVWVSNSIVNPYLFCDLYGGGACLGAYETETVVFTATFPLIAFEYGHIWWAPSTRVSAVC